MAATSAAQLAQQLAQSAAPTRSSVVQPFNQGIADTGNFTDAALANLRAQIGNTSSGYGAAEGAQNAQTAAAMARLSALGGQYGAGSAATAGGMGDAAASRLLASGAAANAYANQIPGALAARGQLLQAGLIKGRQQALQQRSQAITQAFPQYLQQVHAQRLAEQQFGLSQKQFGEQQKVDAQNNALRWATLHQNANQFTKTQAQQYSEFLQQQAAATAAATARGTAGFTPTEIHTMVTGAQKSLDSWTTQGMTIQNAIQRLAQSMPIGLAKQVAAVAYGQITKPVKPNLANYPNSKTPGAAKAAYQHDLGVYRADLANYNQEIQSWRRFMKNQVERGGMGHNPNPTAGSGQNAPPGHPE